MIRPSNIHSVTDFTRNAKAYIAQVKASMEPIALTVNGHAEVILQDAETYQQMVDELERIHLAAALRVSEAALREGKYKDLDQAFGDIRKRLGL